MKKTLILFALGFLFFVNNNTDSKKVFLVYSVDHRLDYPGPINIIGAELSPRETWECEATSDAGRYIVIWYDKIEGKLKNQYSMMVVVPKGTKKVILTPFNYYIS